MEFDNRTFLIVEDSIEDQMLLRRAFKSAEIPNPLLFQNDGESAREFLEHCIKEPGKTPLPVVMITDLTMPRMDGFELLSWIKEQHELRHMTRVVFSASNLEADASRASDCGAHFYLAKPSKFNACVKMVESLRNWLKMVRQPETVRPTEERSEIR